MARIHISIHVYLAFIVHYCCEAAEELGVNIPSYLHIQRTYRRQDGPIVSALDTYISSVQYICIYVVDK